MERSTDIDPQREVIGFLSDPRCAVYGPADSTPGGALASVHRIETHSAHLFVGARRVCKIKRHVAYSYLDMTSLDARRRLCERELEINREVLPEIYLAVAPVTREANGGLAFDGAGEPVEWVLVMNRFDEADVLENVAREGRLDGALAERLGESLARYHAERPLVRVGDGERRVHEVIDELERELRELSPELPARRARELIAACREAWNGCRHVLSRRGRGGYVRRCHGDLHLRNILLWKGRPVPFDALEFDERLATTDVLYDLAFLIMDLERSGLRAESNRLLSAWLAHVENPCGVSGLQALPLFLALRAAIRAMTEAQTARHASPPKEGTVGSARAYLDEALQRLVPESPSLIVLGGLSGSGKTHVARRLALRVAGGPGAVLLDSDSERKAAAGVAIDDPLPEESYTETATEANYRRLIDKGLHAVGAGRTVILTATWLGTSARRLLSVETASLDLPVHRLWLLAPSEELRRRVRLRERWAGPPDASDADESVLLGQLERFDGPPEGWRPIDALGGEEEIVARCLAAVTRRDRRVPEDA